jgi:hypothetical protein
MKIAFAGKARSGKDTAVDYLMSKLDGTSVKIHVADPIYTLARNMLETPVINNKIPKIRKLLQDLGSAGREFNPNFWVNKLIEEVCRAEHEMYENIFITGIRYPNEVEALRRAGFRVVYLYRNEIDRVVDGASNTTHHSENSLNENMFPAEDVVYNISTVDEFKQELSLRILG